MRTGTEEKATGKAGNVRNASMTADDLRTLREAMGLTAAQLSRDLETPYRTYIDWEGGRRRIPGIVGIAINLLRDKQRWVIDSSVLHGVASVMPEMREHNRRVMEKTGRAS